MPNVEVRDAEGALIRTYKIYADVDGVLIKTEDLFEMAKRNAVEDKLVDEAAADGLSFRVAE